MKHFKKSKLTRPGHSQPRMSFLVKLLEGIGLKILTLSKAFLANPSWAFKFLIALKLPKLSLDSGTDWLSAPCLTKNQPDPKTLSQSNTIFLPEPANIAVVFLISASTSAWSNYANFLFLRGRFSTHLKIGKAFDDSTYLATLPLMEAAVPIA